MAAAQNPVIVIQGAKKLRKELKKAGVDMNILTAPHKYAARTVMSVAVPRTPRRSGRLAASTRASGTRTAGVVRAGNNGNVPYANPIHWGWPRRNIGAQPWLTTAAAQSEPIWLPVFIEHMNSALAGVEGVKI